MYELFSVKKRGGFIWKLSQNIIIEQKAERITTSVASYADVKKLLLKRGAATECYVLSINSVIDGTTISLDDALYNVVGAGPELISYIHGKLAYLECEQGDYGAPARFILYDGCK